MNEKIIEEKYLKLINYVKNLSDREKAILTEYLNAHRNEFHEHTVDTLIDGMKYTMAQYITETLTIRDSLIQDGDEGKSKSIADSLNQDRGKTFVQTMSQPLEDYRNNLQSSRDERYNNMIEEYEDKERKELINKLKKELSRLDYHQINVLINELLVAPDFDDDINRFENQLKIRANWDNFILCFKDVIDIERYKSLSKIDIVEAIKDVYNNYEEYSKSSDIRMGK